MRSTTLAALTCALPLLTACPDNTGESASSPTSDSDATTAGPTPDTGTDGGTTAPTTPTSTDPTTTAEPTTTEPTETTGPVAGGNKMEKFGHECAGDSDCVAVLGEGAVCLKDILMVYELPGGYCSLLCMLPDENTAYVEDAPECGQGVTCLGAKGYFEGCAIECTDNSECPRTGYECRTMPQIGQATDPKFCLMTDEYML